METKRELRAKIEYMEGTVKRVEAELKFEQSQVKALRERCDEANVSKEAEILELAIHAMRHMGVLQAYDRNYPPFMAVGDYGYARAVNAFRHDLKVAVTAMDADDAQDRLSGNFKTTEKGE